MRNSSKDITDDATRWACIKAIIRCDSAVLGVVAGYLGVTWGGESEPVRFSHRDPGDEHDAPPDRRSGPARGETRIGGINVVSGLTTALQRAGYEGRR